TRSIPIVFTRVVDPVEAGFVASLARPGGNITGFTPAESSVFGKLLDVFKELAPRITRVAGIFHPDPAPQAGNFAPNPNGGPLCQDAGDVGSRSRCRRPRADH